jgi:hypothetical protein
MPYKGLTDTSPSQRRAIFSDMNFARIIRFCKQYSIWKEIVHTAWEYSMPVTFSEKIKQNIFNKWNYVNLFFKKSVRKKQWQASH